MQRGVRTDEDVLDDVVGLRVGPAQQPARIPAERGAVTRVELRERVWVAGGDAAGELAVIGSGHRWR